MGEKIFRKLLAIWAILLFFLMASYPAVSAQNINTKLKNESVNENICDLLILAPSRFEKSLQPLVKHKNSYGMQTNLVSLDYVYARIWYGHDNAEKVKLFIKDAYEECGIKYVMLVGGIKKQFAFYEDWWCPVRYVHVEDWWSGFEAPYDEKRFLTDLYFGDIYDSEGRFCSWDDDGDGIYGEWNNNNSAEDVLDLYPEVYVGRLPCRNDLEVKIMVNKIINYEKENHTGKDWYKKMVVVAGDTYPGDDYEGETETQKALDRMPGFEPIKLWVSNGNFTGTKVVVDTINSGCGFLYFAGHGNPSLWGNHDPSKDQLVYGLQLNNIPFLLNMKKLPICVMGGCHNSLFNVSLFHTSWNGKMPCLECITWRLTRKIGGGTIATIGNTGLGYGPKDKKDPSQGGAAEPLISNFFGEIGLNNTQYLGEAIGKGICSFLDEFPIYWHENSYNDSSIDAKTVLEWVLFGDPSLKIGGY